MNTTPEEDKVLKEIGKEIKKESQAKNLNPEGMYFFKPSLHIDTDKNLIFVSVPIAFPRIIKGKPILDTQVMTIKNNDAFILDENSITDKNIFPISMPDLPLPSRWENKDINLFLSELNVVSVIGVRPAIFNFDTYNIIKNGFDHFIEFSSPIHSVLLSVFIMMGYLLPIFNAVPFINLTGTRGGGKTKTIEFLYQLCFNAESTSNTSPSALFRIIENNCSTILLDESEKLTGLEKDPDIRLLLNACYRKGGQVTRSNKDTHRTERFKVFADAVIAAQNDLEPTLLSRCISIVMIKTASDKGKLSIDDKSYDWQNIRNRLYRFIFNGSEDVEKIYRNQDFGKLNCRKLDIWKPLLSIALYLDSGTDKPYIYDTLKEMAENEEEEQNTLTYLEELTLNVLFEVVQVKDKYWSKHILSRIKTKASEEETLGLIEKVNSRTISSILRKFGFQSLKKERTGEGIPYRISPEQVIDIAKRYNASLQPLTPTTPTTQNEANQKSEEKINVDELWGEKPL